MKRILILAVILLIVCTGAFAAWKPQAGNPLITRVVLSFPSGPYVFVPDVPIEYLHIDRIGGGYYNFELCATDGTIYYYSFDQIRAGIRLNLEE